MVNTNELRGIMARENKTGADMAKLIGVTPQTWYRKMKTGDFGTSEAKIMIDELNIKNPVEIFFA